jgi:flagellar protein FlbD
VLKLTRLNNQTVAINPDHIAYVDVVPDTTICLTNGYKIIVRETLDELIAIYVSVRRRIHSLPEGVCPLGRTEQSPPVIPLRSDEEE